MATGRRGLTAVAALWGLSAAISVGPLFGWKEPDPEDESVCRITEEPGYALFSALGSFYIPLAIILAMYCRVYAVATRETKTFRRGNGREEVETEGVMLRIHRGSTSHLRKDDEDATAKQKQTTVLLRRLLKSSREEKAARTLGIVVGCFVLCWLPFFLVLPIGSMFPSCKPSETIFKITFWLGYLNSCINPIIYPCSSREFKKAFLNVLHGCCLRTGTPAAKTQGQITSSGADPSPAAASCCFCGALSTSSASTGGPDRAQSSQIQRKSLLKTWCFSSSRTPVPQHPSGHGSAKVLRLSLGVAGDDV